MLRKYFLSVPFARIAHTQSHTKDARDEPKRDLLISDLATPGDADAHVDVHFPCVKYEHMTVHTRVAFPSLMFSCRILCERVYMIRLQLAILINSFIFFFSLTQVIPSQRAPAALQTLFIALLDPLQLLPQTQPTPPGHERAALKTAFNLVTSNGRRRLALLLPVLQATVQSHLDPPGVLRKEAPSAPCPHLVLL